MRHLGILSLIVCLAAASGCNLCCWGKRNSELTGPTDIRKSQLWCLGEDAEFAQPMGPSRQDYGLKATCWREWPAGGAQCTDNSCGPVFSPAVPSSPAHLPHPTPTQEVLPQGGPQLNSNPFLDDAHPMPAPAASGARLMSPSGRSPSTASQPANFQSLFSTPPTTAPSTHKSLPTNRKVAQKAAIPPRYVAVPAAPAKSPFSGKAVPPNKTNGLHISVSEAIDAPARSLAPIAGPGMIVRAAVANSTSPEAQQETLASLERLMDAPAENPAGGVNGPAIIRNDYAVAAEPFRLATRDSLPTAKRDPVMEKETLSALELMMSGDEPAATEE